MSDYWKKVLDEWEKNNQKSPTKKTTSSNTKKTVTPTTKKEASSDYWGNVLAEWEEEQKRKKQQEDIAPVKTTTQTEDEDDGKFGSWLGNSAMSGLGMFNKGVTSTADLILGKPLQALGWKNNPISAAADYYSDSYDYYKGKANEEADKLGGEDKNILGMGNGYDIAGSLVEGTVAAVPTAIEALMTMGTSLAPSILGSAGGATASSLATTAAYRSGNILTKAGLTVESMAKNPQFWTSFAQTYGTDYEEAKEKGADETTAILGATLTSLLNAGVETGIDGLSGIQGLPEKVANGGKSAIWEWVKSSLEEGVEEPVQGVISRTVNKVLYGSDEAVFDGQTMLTEGLTGTVVGGVLGGGQIGVQSTTNAIKQAQVNKLTENEQKVVDKVVENRIAEEELAGKPVTATERKAIEKQVKDELFKGGISTDTIEEVLGGDTYKAYKDAIDGEMSLQKEYDTFKSEYDTLNGMKRGDMTGVQQDRQAELKAQMDELKAQIENKDTIASRDQLKAQLGDEVFNIAKDSRLVESYNERARRGQAYEADLSKYDAKQQKVIKSAIDSGILNNTRRTHEFVDFIARISADKGVPFDFANNKKMAEYGFTVQGATVNGVKTDDGRVVLNIDAAKSLNSVTGHEITHILEGTKLYEKLQKAAFDFAESKGEYDSRLDALTNLYRGKKGYETNFDEKVKAELTADLVGDYLFTDEAFIKKLSVEHRNVFQKIYDEVKYLLKVATAGSAEARELEKVKRAFEKAYKESGKGTKNTKWSISAETDTAYLDAVKRGDTEAAQMMVDKAAKDAGYDKKMFHETDADNIHIFDVTRGTHGGTDSETPYGIFTKSSAKNIGLGGKQMALYVNAKNTLNVENRAEVKEKIPELIPYYDEITRIDQEYDALSEEYEDAEFEALQEWMEANPDADMDVVFPTQYIIDGKPADIDSPAYLDAHNKHVQVMEEWKSEYNKVAVKCKEIITEYLRNNGYDSMYFKVDGGSRGRQTDSLILLDSNQVKSADAITKDDSGNVIPLSQRFNAGNDDIRYSLSSMGTTFFGNENMSIEEFTAEDYKRTTGYQNYVNECLNNYKQSRGEMYDEAVARKEIEDGIDGIVRVAIAAKKAGYDIFDDGVKRSKTDSKNRLLFSSLEPNSDYFTSNDISTICDKRQNFADIYDDIVRAEEAKGVPQGKRFFDNIDNYFYLHGILAEKGLTQPCRQCYVESMRKNLAPMASAFLRLVNETDANNTANDQLYQQKGKNKGALKTNNAALRERVLDILAESEMSASDLTVEMLTTEDGLAQLKITAPLVYEAFNSFYGQSKPKMPKSATPFRFGELTALLTKDDGTINERLVKKINATGGFRLQSYSDFQIQNYTDVLQVIFEAGTLGLSGHAYTKVPAFLEATEGTNLKRNISIFMYKDGNEWKLDRNDSFPYTLEEIYDIVNADKSGNTGIIAVSQNEDMSAWIMANDYIAYGIPFHKSGLKMGTVRDTIVKDGDREIKGYTGTKDHTRQQTEVWAKTTADHKALTKVKDGINIYEFWDFDNKENLSKNKLIEKNVKAYINECEKAGYLPKFREYVINNDKVLNSTLAYAKELGFVPQDATIEDISFKYKGYTIPYGYYKFLGDFGMFTPDGKASPHEALSLKEYDFDKAVKFFEDSETLRRNEILQQFANDGERQKYAESNLTAEELLKIVKQKRVAVVDDVLSRYDAPISASLSAEGETAPTYGNYNVHGKDIALDVAPVQEAVQEDVAPVQDSVQDAVQDAPKDDNAIPEGFAPATEEDTAAIADESFAALDDADAPPIREDIYDDMPDTTAIGDNALKRIAQSVRDSLALNSRESKAIQEVIQKYSTAEMPSRDALAAEIREKFGERTLVERNEELAEVKQAIRKSPISVSDTAKGDITDYTAFMRSNFGKVRFSKNGLPVDTAYMELAELYPAYFPADITTESDQLMRIVEVANEDVNTDNSYELSDEDIYDAVDIISVEVGKYKTEQLLKAVEAQNREALWSLRGVDPMADETTDIFDEDIAPTKEADRTEPIQTAEERVAAKLQNAEAELAKNKQLRQESWVLFDEKINRLKVEYNFKKSKDTKAANDILQRIETLKRRRADVDADYAKRISDVSEKINKMNSPVYKMAEQRRAKQERYASDMENLVGDTSTWVDKKLGLSYKVNTLRRNLRDVVRDANGNRDIAKADAIYDELQGKYNHNEAALNREATRIKQPYAEMDITKAEDAYIQMLGELRHNPDTTLTEEAVTDYYNKHKKDIDKAKVDKVINDARDTYDSLLKRVNAVLKEQGMKEIPYRKGYFPHFTDPKQGFLAKLFNWKTQDFEIPTDIAGLTEAFNPNRSWQSFNKERKSDITDYSFTKGMDTYVQGALDWIYHIEDIQKRRAFENHIRYVHSDEGVKDRINKIRQNEEFDADEVQEQIDLVYKEAKNPLNNFVQDLRAGTNTLAGKKSSLDRGMEEMVNRKAYSTMTNLSNRVTGNMVVGSVSSALTNFIPITQSWVEVSPFKSLRAMGDTIRSTFRDDGTIAKSDFLTNRLRKADNLYKTGWDKAAEKAAFLMEGIDSFTSQVVWRSKYLDNLSNNMSESAAIKNADQFAENVIAGRSRGNMPTIFDSKNPLVKALTAFQLEVNNQYGYMFKDAPQDIKNKSVGRLVAGYATAFFGAYAYNALYSSLVGRDAAFDPVGIIEDLLRDMFGDDDDEEKEPAEIASGLIENVVQEAPFVGGLFGGGRIPISAAMPYDGIGEMITGTATDIGEKDYANLTKEWLNPVYYLALPFGGGQIKKTVEGLSMFSDKHPVSGSYTTSGNLRYPVEDTLGNKLQAALFGQYSNKNARYYFDNELAPLKEKQIQEYKDLELPIREYWDYREGLKGLETTEEKLDYINSLDLPIRKKNIMANNVTDRKDPIDMSEYDDYGSLDEFDFATKYPEKYDFFQKNGISYEDYKSADEDGKRAYSWAYDNPDKVPLAKAVAGDIIGYRKYTSDLYDLKADKDEDGETISGSAKEKKLDYINSLALDYGQKIILYRSLYSSKDDKATYNRAIVEYLDSRDDISWDDMKAILEELDFTVYDDGTIEW